MSLSRRERREQRRKLLKEQRLEVIKKEDDNIKSQSSSQTKGFLGIYDKHYKTLFLIPLLLFIFGIVGMSYQIATTGEFINKGVSLKGGITLSIPVNNPVSIDEIESLLKKSLSSSDIEIRSIDEFGIQKAIIITTDDFNSEEKIINILSDKIPNAKENYSSETTGATLGKGFFKQTVIAMILAFVFMAIVVFLSFKTLVPSAAVILCAFADILETIVIVNLLGIKVSTAGIAAFLMLIGYSVDTDILLTSRVLRSKEGSVFQRIVNAAKTGLLMTVTALIAVTISFFVTNSSTIKEIMLIMMIGLILDIINTWIQNTAILRYYMERKFAKTTKNDDLEDSNKVEPEIIDIDEEDFYQSEETEKK